MDQIAATGPVTDGHALHADDQHEVYRAGTIHSARVSAPSRRGYYLALTGAGVVAAGALVAGPAAAAKLGAFIDRAPQNAEDVERMEVLYQGRSYTWAQIYDLQDEGKAGYTVQEPTTYNQGQAHAFDSAEEAEAWTCANVAGLATRPVCLKGDIKPASVRQ